jgi:hypothetical protein
MNVPISMTRMPESAAGTAWVGSGFMMYRATVRKYITI